MTSTALPELFDYLDIVEIVACLFEVERWVFFDVPPPWHLSMRELDLYLPTKRVHLPEKNTTGLHNKRHVLYTTELDVHHSTVFVADCVATHTSPTHTAACRSDFHDSFDASPHTAIVVFGFR